MAENGVAITPALPSIESINRFSKIPLVESSIQTATSLYGKVKDYNNLTNWTFSTAESTVLMAVDMGKPIATPMITKFEHQIKKVDDAVCSGLDYVETKVPAVKMPTEEICTTTKDYYKHNLEPAMQTARSIAEPAVKTAKTLVEPAVGMAMQYVEPAMNKVNAAKENFLQKVDEYLHRGQNHSNGSADCEECKKVKEARAAEAEEINN